jgi:hypothetical protein
LDNINWVRDHERTQKIMYALPQLSSSARIRWKSVCKCACSPTVFVSLWKDLSADITFIYSMQRAL